jgi:hypothetical protein
MVAAGHAAGNLRAGHVDPLLSDRYESVIVRTVYVGEYPVIQHLHADNEVVSVRLKRRDGTLKAVCPGCDTEFVYRKPGKSRVQHFKSPLLPPVKGNFDTGGEDP